MGSSQVTFPNAPRIIGLTGHARAGKDTVAGILGDLAAYQRVAFADPLKAVALACDPFVGVHDGELVRLAAFVNTVGWESAKAEPEVRRFLQVLGTEGVRANLGDTIWIDTLKRRIEQLPPASRVVVTDVRFPNEAEAVRLWGGQVWRVRRPDYRPGAAGTHVSEAGQSTILPDYTIENDSGLAELRATVRDALGFYAPREVGA